MQQQMNTNSSVPITTAAGILNLDHYKYLRSLLPPVPHFIESLSFTDLNNWECQIYVNLVTDSDCIKWLADFEDKTSTEWKADHNASRALANSKVKGCHWQMVYRCSPLDSKKDCTAKLEMKIVGAQDDRNNSKHGKQYPCQVSINFYHNHNTTTNTSMFNADSLKAQDIPSHLKEGFEGYFQETMQPVNHSSSVSVGGLKGTSVSLLNSPLTHTLSKSGGGTVNVSLSPGEGQHLDGKLLHRQTDLSEVTRKLEQAHELLRAMLKQTGTPGSNAVRQFVDKFDKLRGDRTQLEDALTSFGGQWDWLGLAHNSENSDQQQVAQQQPAQEQVPSPPVSPHHLEMRRKSVKRELEPETEIITATTTTLQTIPQQVFSTSIVGGQVLLQQQTQPLPPQPQPSVPSEGPDTKRRKRARCGTCSGCLNRDKTQDCRQCRNCLDQKRYGGPGRLKKACVKRQCVVISQMIASELSPEQKQNLAAQQQQQQHQQQQQQQLAQSVKSEPVFSVKTENTNPVYSLKTEPVSMPHLAQSIATSQTGQTLSLQGGHSVQVTQAMSTASTLSQGTLSSPLNTLPTGPTLLSWPGAHYAPIQVQVQQPVQFAFQPQGYGGATVPAGTQIQYTTGLSK